MTPRRSNPPAERLAQIGIEVGCVALAFGLGTAGAFLAITGWGQITVVSTLWNDAIIATAAVCSGWLVLDRLLRGRHALQAVARGAALAAALALGAASAGRAVAVLAVVSVMVADAALTAWQPTPRWPPRPHRVVPLAVVVVALAQVAWLATGSVALGLVIDLVALALVELHHRRASWFEPWYRGELVLAQRLDDAGSGALRSVHRWWLGTGASWGRRGAASLRAAGAWVAARPASWRADPERSIAMAITAVLTGIIWHRYASEPAAVLGSSDFETHLFYVEQTSLWPLRVPLPHPTFHIATATVALAVGTQAATVIVLSTASAITASMLVKLCRRSFGGSVPLPAWWGAAFAVATLFADTPSLISRALHIGNPWDWAPAARMVLSPSETVLFPIALALLVRTADAVRRARPPTTAETGTLAALAVAAMVTKPTFAVVLVPSVAAYLTMRRRWERHLATSLAIALVVPAIAVGVWQLWFLRVGAGGFPSSDVVIDPLATVRAVNLHRTTPLAISHMAVVALCLWAGAKRYLGEPIVALAALGVGFAAIELLLLAEDGPRAFDGNFAKPAFTAGALLYLASWRFLLGEAAAWRRRGGRAPAWLIASVAFAVVNLVAGTLGYLEAVGALALPVHGG